MNESTRNVVRWFRFRFGALNGYNFALKRWMGTSKARREDARRQYVNDMRWVREALRRA